MSSPGTPLNTSAAASPIGRSRVLSSHVDVDSRMTRNFLTQSDFGLRMDEEEDREFDQKDNSVVFCDEERLHQSKLYEGSTKEGKKVYDFLFKAQHVRNEDREKEEAFVNHFRRVNINEPLSEQVDDEVRYICGVINEALCLRQKYLFVSKLHSQLEKIAHDPTSFPFAMNFSDNAQFAPFNAKIPSKTKHVYEMTEGVFNVYVDEQAKERGETLSVVHSWNTFCKDLQSLMVTSSYGPVRSFCHRRLKILDAKFNLHTLLNDSLEIREQQKVPHRDFYNVRKVDNHVHHSSMANQKHLLRFIKAKLKKAPHDIVLTRGDPPEPRTLMEVFKDLELDPHDLSVDALDVHAGHGTFQRFDRFNSKYNPFSCTTLREIFLKIDNHIQGRYLAELTKEVFSDHDANKYQMAEYRLSIYGKNLDEWDVLSHFVCDHKLFSEKNRWMIQIPRLYHVYRSQGLLSNFEEFLNNIFSPLFAATQNPTEHPLIHLFLQQVVGFDSVDDESLPEVRLKTYPPPHLWTSPENPPYAYYLYYMYSNLYQLNKFRESKGFTTFALRPHAGESGDVDHLATAFLLAESISHGVVLRHSVFLQYVYYLEQIGIAVSPISNNTLFITYRKHPFPQFFGRGLKVSLTTDDPLQFHLSKEPLVEEYALAAQLWKLSNIDLCEIARNSVLISGFEHNIKGHWLGPNYLLGGVEGNDIERTNIPQIRVAYRAETLRNERDFISLHSPEHTHSNLSTPPV
eukprot:GCRY01005296.1.p1 GENE.GCRY01005296.1~~GCRY01005296.1.p1  ORF type:complete len:740 (-),score=199.59 GCRY01005296.1:314-2533(-)